MPFNYLKRHGFSFDSLPPAPILPQATRLDLALSAQYIAAPAAGPFLGSPARLFSSPDNRARIAAHLRDEGWAHSGCSDSKKLPTTDATETMAFSPFKFLQEVRSETAKVTWPTRRETTITTIMVFVMVALASVFFFAADQVIRILVTFVLGIH
jgi:preprotein translocase SecE subunit